MKQAIIILNQGDAWFLKYTLHQARASSPDVPIFLLGDSANHKYNGTAEHHLISDYADAAGPFSAVYEHMSSNARWIELLCFQRWFIINRFVAAKGIERCLYLDTDAMLYADARAELDRLSGCDLALCGASGPSTLYFQNAKTLDALANFIYKTYAEPAGIAQLRTRFETYRATGRPGGICDMTLLGDFVRTGQARHGDLLEIRDNSVYDDNINSSDGFETAGEKAHPMD